MAELFRVTAIISAFNEGDIISPVIEHLIANGVDVYLIDNHSTDDTVEQARRWLGKGVLEIEQFPPESEKQDDPSDEVYDWTGILRRKEQLAQSLDSDWFIHHDADEFREVPWPGMTLHDAIRWVDTLGYNCIGFHTFNFPPVDNDYEPGTNPREHFTYCKEAEIYDRLQLKCWKKTSSPVSLIPSGGHQAEFANRHVFPISFLMRHYPIRSEEHGRRKVFEERFARFSPEERQRGWHIQYDALAAGEVSFLGDISKLKPYDPEQLRLDALLKTELWGELDQKLEEAAAQLGEKEGTISGLQTRAAVLERLVAEKERRIQELIKGGREALYERTVDLERERHEAAQEARALEQRVATIEAALENEKASRAAEVAALQKGNEILSADKANLGLQRAELQAQLDYMFRSISWRSTAPLRWLRRLSAKVSTALRSIF